MYLDPRQFDAYKELDPSQQAVIDQLAESLTRQSWSSRKRLYASRVLRMGALTMATGVPVAIAAGAPNWVGALRPLTKFGYLTEAHAKRTRACSPMILRLFRLQPVRRVTCVR
jgi:hypothetical protein